VNAQIVPNDDVTRAQCRGKTVLDPHEHGLAIYGTRHHHRGYDSVNSKTSNNAVVGPAIARNIVDGSFTDRSPRHASSHRQVHSTLVYKDQPGRIPVLLCFTEGYSCFDNIGSVAL